MSGQTVLCEVCRITIEFDYKRGRWGDVIWNRPNSDTPYPHQHRERGE